jgi:hypothetical protein
VIVMAYQPSPRGGVTAAPRRRSSRSRRSFGTTSDDEVPNSSPSVNISSTSESSPLSRDSREYEKDLSKETYSIYSGRTQPRVNSSSPSSKSSKLKNPFFSRVSNREKEYNELVSRDSLTSSSINSGDMKRGMPNQRPSLHQENSVGTATSIRSLSSRSSRYRPSNSVIGSRGTLGSDTGSIGSGFPRSIGGNSTHSVEPLTLGKIQSHTNNAVDRSPNYEKERKDAELDLRRGQTRKGHHSLGRIQQEDSSDDSSQGSNLSDIMMRPSSSIPQGEQCDHDDYFDYEARDYDRIDFGDEMKVYSKSQSGSDASKAEANVAHVLMRLSDVDDVDDNIDDNDEIRASHPSRNNIDGGILNRNSGWSVASVSDRSCLSSNLSGVKEEPTTPVAPSKSRNTIGAGPKKSNEETKNHIFEASSGDRDYYNRIKTSTLNAYNDEDDDDSIGSEDLDVLGNIPNIFHVPNISRHASKDDDDENSNSHHSSLSLSDDDDKRESNASPGVVTARPIRPQNNKANRPTRKKPPPKLPVNPLISKNESNNLSNSQLSDHSHSDGGSTVLARHNNGGSFVAGGLHRSIDPNQQANKSTSSISGGLRRINNNTDDHGKSSSRISVSGGLRKVENGNNQSSKSFFGRSMLMLKMFTGNNANNASMSSVPTDTGGENLNTPNHNSSNNQLVNKKMNRSQSGSQQSLLTDVAETVYSVNTVEMKNPGTFMHSKDAAPSSFSNLLDESKSMLEEEVVEGDDAIDHTASRNSEGTEGRDERMKSEKFQRMMMMKKQYSSSRASPGFVIKQQSSVADKEMKATKSMAMMIQKANQLDKKPRVPMKKPTTSSVSNNSKGKGMSRKSSAMVMNMQGLGMNMSDISKNLERTVSRSVGDTPRYSPSKRLDRQHGGSIKSLNKGGKQDQEDEGSENDESNDSDSMDELLVELDCGPNLDNPILSYKQAQRVRAFHMPGLIEADTMTLIQHPMNSKFGWFEFPFRKIFAKDPSPSDMVIEKYGIGLILWFRFLKAFAIVFIVMFVVNVPAMSMFYHGTYYPAARTASRIDNSPTDILTTTTMGNLGVQLQYCHVVRPGEEIHIDCFGGVVENVIAYYGTPSGECSCPSVQQPKKNGDCPGSIVESESGLQECEVGRYNKKLACFDGDFRREKCCGFERDDSGETDLSDLTLSPDYTCNSLTAQYIASGMCLGKETCTLGTDASHMYHWEGALATNLNNSDVCETGFDSGSFNNSDASFCTTSLGYSGIWDSCPDSSTLSLKLNVKCSEKNIKAFGTDMTRNTIVFTASILNAIAVSTFIFAVYWVSKQQEEEDAEMDRSTCRATDYTVRCVKLPEHNSSNELANQLKKHFESKLSKCKPCFLPGKVRVADINLTTGSFKYLQAAIKRGKASRDLDLVRYKKTVMDYLNEEKSWRYKFFEKWEEHAMRTFNHYNDICLKKFIASLNGDKKVIIAYVTFETEEGYLRALENNIPIEGKHMRITRAEDPSDILWENLGTPVLQRLIRRSITTFLLIVLLLMTYFIVAYAIERSESNSTDWPLIIACDDFTVSLDKNDNSTDLNVITYEKTLRDHKWQYYNNTSGRQGYVNCYCQEVMNEGTVRRALDYLFYDAELNSEERWCKNLLWDEFTLIVIKLAVSMVVLTVNLSAKTILHVMKEFERMASYSLISQSMTVKLFMIQIVNTGMLALLMNGDAGLSKDNTVAFMNGDYEDFTPEWYDDIGKTVLQTVTLYTIGVHGVKFAVFFLHKFLRWRDRGFGSDFRITKQVSQENLNKLYLGPEFVIEVRYATVLTVCFVCIAYAPAMPLLYLIGGLGFWATYLIDKWFFLRVYRIPQATSPQLAHTVTKSLYVSAILNLLLSIWIYSNIMLFDPITRGEETEVYVNGMKFLEVTFNFHTYDTISDRVFSKYALASWVVFIPFLLFLVLLLLTSFMNEHNYKGGAFLSRFLNLINTERMFEGNPPYFNVIPATLLVRRLEEGMAKPHILAAYEKQLLKVEVEGEDDKLMEGLESYKIELNEIYADKIAINSDYMSKVRPMDLFAEDETLDDHGGSFEDDDEDGDVLANNNIVMISKGRGKSGRGLTRSNTLGGGLSGADYEWTDDAGDTPKSGEPEKDIFTLLKEKKKALREWRRSQAPEFQPGDEVKQQNDSSDEEDSSFEGDSNDDDDEETIVVDETDDDKTLSRCSSATDVTAEHSYYSSTNEDNRQLPDKHYSNPFLLGENGNNVPGPINDSQLFEWDKVKEKSENNKLEIAKVEKEQLAKSATRDKQREHIKERTNPRVVNDRHNSLNVAKTGTNPLKLRDQDREVYRNRERDRHSARGSSNPLNSPANTKSTAVSNFSGDTGESRRFRRGSHSSERQPEGGDLSLNDGGSERRYYDLVKKSDDRRSSNVNDKSLDDGARSSRDKDKHRDKLSSGKHRRDREDSGEHKRRHHHRERDRDREDEKEDRRHRERESDRRHRDREKTKEEGVKHRTPETRDKDDRRHRRGDRESKDKHHRSEKDRDVAKDSDRSRDRGRRKSHHPDDKEKSSRRTRRISLPDAVGMVTHRGEKKDKELQLGFLSATSSSRKEKSVQKDGVEDTVETVSASFSNLF